MAGSPAFARIERDVLRIIASIPRGKVCTYTDAGACIDVPARHVAYICSRLDEATLASHPVHRMVNDKGMLPAKALSATGQLATEGVVVQNGKVLGLQNLRYNPSAARPQLERTTRPPEHARGATLDGKAVPALSELRGLGPVSVQTLASVGVTSTAQLRKADLFKLYALIKAKNPRTSINLLYAMLGAVEDVDWREIAKERRTEILIRLDDMGLA